MSRWQDSGGSPTSSRRQNKDCQWSDDSDFEFEDRATTERSEKIPNSRPAAREVDKTAARGSDDELKVGVQFDSFLELGEAVRRFQQRENCVFYIRDCVTIARSLAKGLKRVVNSQLKYYWLKYCCIHGGKKFQSKSDGKRSSSTFQKECPAYFSFNVNGDGTKLVLVSMKNDHNHKCSEKLYRHLPQVRLLSTEEKAKVGDLLKLGAKKKMVKQKVSTETGKEVMLKDLSNIMARQEDQNNLQSTIQKLQNNFGAECHVFEEEGIFKGLFFVTKAMQQSMESYPEFIGIDATFKLLDIRAPIYLVIIEDSEGSTEIVAVCILVSEDAASMRWLLHCFKKVHPAWIKIKSVMADKDLLERKIIKEEFPSANVLICVFHSLRTFNREISCDKLGITPGQRDTAKELFQKMLYAKTESEYMRYYEECQTLPKSIMVYFNANWHNIRSEWTLSRDFMTSTFLNTTNNRVESLNAKVKSVVKRYSTLEEFVESFFVLVACLRSERDHKAAYNYQKSLVVTFKKNSVEWLYYNLLTRLAFEYVRKELHSSKRGKFVIIAQNNELFELQFHESRVFASPQSCDCPSFASMMLPCRHIFVVRQRLEQHLYDGSLCNERWTRDYYCKTQRVFDDEAIEAVDIPNATICSQMPVHRILSQNERYRKMFVVAKELAGLGSEVTGDEFIERLKLLTDVKNEWIKNRQCHIVGTSPQCDRANLRNKCEVVADDSDDVINRERIVEVTKDLEETVEIEKEDENGEVTNVGTAKKKTVEPIVDYTREISVPGTSIELLPELGTGFSISSTVQRNWRDKCKVVADESDNVTNLERIDEATGDLEKRVEIDKEDENGEVTNVGTAKKKTIEPFVDYNRAISVPGISTELLAELVTGLPISSTIQPNSCDKCEVVADDNDNVINLECIDEATKDLEKRVEIEKEDEYDEVINVVTAKKKTIEPIVDYNRVISVPGTSIELLAELVTGFPISSTIQRNSRDKCEVVADENDNEINLERIDEATGDFEKTVEIEKDEVINVTAKKKTIEPIVDFSKIKVPAALKRKGRPKGCDKTVIGLSKRRKISVSVQKIPFEKRRSEEKSVVILQWLVDKEVAISAINQGVLVQKTFVKTKPDEVTHSLIDSDVNIKLVQKYFQEDAWKLVEQIFEYQTKNHIFYCGKCSADLDETIDEGGTSKTISTNDKFSIRCDYCMIWYHLACVSLKKIPKTKYWKCKFC